MCRRPKIDGNWDGGWGWLTRSSTNRSLLKGEQTTQKLYQTIDNWEVADIYSVKLPATDKRSAHDATLILKFGAINVAKPKQHTDDSLSDSIAMYAIEVKESELRHEYHLRNSESCVTSAY